MNVNIYFCKILVKDTVNSTLDRNASFKREDEANRRMMLRNNYFSSYFVTFNIMATVKKGGGRTVPSFTSHHLAYIIEYIIYLNCNRKLLVSYFSAMKFVVFINKKCKEPSSSLS